MQKQQKTNNSKLFSLKQISEYYSVFFKLAQERLKHLPEAQAERLYIEERIPREDIRDKFLLSYFPKSKNNILDLVDQFGNEIDEDPIPPLEAMNLLYITEKNNKIVFIYKHHHLLLPFFDMYGNIISAAARTLLTNEQCKELKIGKYKNLPFQRRRHLYGLNFAYMDAVKYDKIYITEGQIDLIGAHMCGMNNIVALTGTAITFEHICLLKRFTNNFYMIVDNDEAGSTCFDKLNKQSSNFDLKCKKLLLPEHCHDLYDFAKYCNFEMGEQFNAINI